MRIVITLLSLLMGIIVSSAAQCNPLNNTVIQPVAKRQPVTSKHHGISISDDYAWLKAHNWQESLGNPQRLPDDIKDYLNAENAYFTAQMAATIPLQKKLYQELVGRIVEDDSSVPALDNDYAYLWRYIPGKNYRVLYRRPASAFNDTSALYSLEPSEHDEVVLDRNLLAKGKSSFSLGAAKHTQNHQLLAYSVDLEGAEHYQIFVRDLKTGNNLPDQLLDTDGNITWLVDGSGFFYIRLDENSRARSVWHHRLGTSQDADVLVFETPAASGFSTSVWITHNRQFYGIGVGDYHTGEVYLIDVKKPFSEPQLITRHEPDLQYSISQHTDKLFIRTNADDADDFKIMTAPLHSPQRKYWKDLVPHKPGRFIVSMGVFANYLVRKERVDGIERLVIRRLSDGKEHTVTFKEQAYSLGFSSGYTFDTDILRIHYSSLATPARVYDYDMQTRKFIMRKQQGIPSGHNSDDFVTRRINAVADDGAEIPVTLLYHKDTPLDGTAPLFMQAYGAYGVSQHAYFRENALSLVNRGFILALAHVRGGMDKGYSWYTSGRLDKKINTFSDFIAVAQHLIRKKYSSANRIIAYGSSAGGMIMGYSANQAAELFCAMVMDVPFVDVLNTMLDESLPLTPGEWPEWGNPLKHTADFKNIQSYSPYENVSARDYPHMLVLGNVSDSRVTYWEPAKWVAKLRSMRTNNKVIMFRTDMSSGHTGIRGRYSGLQGVAMIYAFAIKATSGNLCRAK